MEKVRACCRDWMKWMQERSVDSELGTPEKT
jgi:hypothetical protein